MVADTPRRVASLDGLRGLAVGATVAFHLPGVPAPGGMAGVDMFFVLSGFLIGTLLLEEGQTSGRINLTRFWAARARRLLPALLIVLTATAALAWWYAAAQQWSLWKQEAAWSAWYGQNFFLISIADNYFSYGGMSPFGHLWSLSVEEQFYLLFPILVIAGLKVTGKHGNLRRTIAITSLALGAASITYFQTALSNGSAAAAYYDLRGHSFGLLAGVTLACATPWLVASIACSPRRTALVQASGALALGTIAGLAITEATAESYVRLSAPVTVAATALLVLTALNRGPVTQLLTWKPLVWLGLISYGIYLWSVPVTWAVEQPLGGTLTGPGALAVAITATILLAWGSYTFVEMPVRTSPWLKVRPLVCLLSGLIALAVLGAVLLNLPARQTLTTPPTPAPQAAGQLPACNMEGSEDINGIVRRLNCVLYDPGEQRTATVLVVGNSVVQSLVDGLRAVAEEQGWRLWSATITSCPLSPNGVKEAFSEQSCFTLDGAVQEMLATGEVDAIFTVDMFGIGRFADDPAVEADYRSTLQRWSSQAPVILIKDYPTLDAPGTVRFTASPQGEEIARAWTEKARYLDESNTILDQAARGLDRVHLFDISALICPDSWPCPLKVDGVQIWYDQLHFTAQGGEVIVRWLEDEIENIIETTADSARRQGG